jgi:proline iminopeptidase
MKDANIELIWKLTEELSPLFSKNQERHAFYWADLNLYKKAQEIQSQIGLPINNKIFMSVRKCLYSSQENFSVNIEKLATRCLWINELHDLIMGNDAKDKLKNSKVTIFLNSAHYPHIEESKLFCA